MKRLFGVLVIVGLILTAQDTVAQKIGVFLGYGTEVEELGLGVNGEFGINDKVAIAPSFIYWLPEDPVSWWEFNVNAMYYFNKSGSADFYGLAGINLFSAKVEGFDGNSEVGINLGVGANFNIGKNWEPFTELKFVLGDADQLGLFFGARFKLRK
ncbi:MAG: porin family protein [Cyclobacteriaceae bacterium]|nr:porin family protein [Cyclobacteriaceae bacterium]